MGVVSGSGNGSGSGSGTGSSSMMRERGMAQKTQDFTVSELFQTVSDSILLSPAIRKEAFIVIALRETSGAQLIFTQASPAHRPHHAIAAFPLHVIHMPCPLRKKKN